MQGLERPQPSVSTDKATTSSSGDQHDDRNEYVNESDDDVRRVPEMGAQTLLGQSVDSGVAIKGESDPSGPPIPSTSAPTPRKRGRTTADKEHKRLKRLLRNRVSAQQARERKKAYLNDLENRAKDLQQRNSELEERISTLQNENFMLRQILKNTTRSKGSGNSEV